MTDPLKIMDEIMVTSIDRIGHEDEVVVIKERWQSLRTAVEAQQDRIEYQDQRHTECAENLVKARARISRIERALGELISVAAQCDSWEYFPEDALDDAQTALNESEPQSLAAVKAEALWEAAAEKHDEAVEAKKEFQPHIHFLVEARWLERRAEHIVREASRSSAKADEREAKES